MNAGEVTLYDAGNLGELSWPDSVDGDYARRFLTPLIQEGVTPYVANVATRMCVLRVDDLVLPFTVNDGERGNSYVASPYTHYVSYAKEEVHLVGNRFVRWGVRTVLGVLGVWMRFGRVDKVVHVNNWLVSTNLYPAMAAEQREAVTDALRRRYPGHALVFRSVHRHRSSVVFDALRSIGYDAVMSRQIYMFDTGDDRNYRRRPFKCDQRLLRRSAYRVGSTSDLTPDDGARLRELYGLLYLDKYSRLNPQYTSEFFALAIREGLFDFRAFRDPAGRIDAFLGAFERGGETTTPMVGYDTELPQRTGLYPLVSTVISTMARDKGVALNLSSGAAEFKRMRGGEPVAEYSLVLVDHLPIRGRVHWKLLAWLTDRFGDRFRERYRF